MKKRYLFPVLVLLALALFPSCHFVSMDDTKIIPDGCFDKVTPITDAKGEEYSKDGHRQFIILTDVHVGRENNDPGVYRNNENFFEFYKSLDKKDMPVLLLGDICDSGKTGYFDLVNEFIEEMRSQRAGSGDPNPMPVIMIPGNHEFMDSDLDTWMRYFGNREDEGLYTLGAYSVGDILLENMNTAYRIYGREQLDAVEYNLKHYGDGYDWKFFLSHVPLASEKFDQSLFWYILADADERNEMLRIMYEYGPSFNLTGHLHEGAQFNEYADRSKEFIFTSFHKRNANRDNGGLWHILDIDQGNGDVIIYAYDIDTKGITEDNYTEKATEITRFNMKTVTP